MRLYGLTGNTGTGKTTVARLLDGKGIPVIDADQLAREVVEPGQPALAEIVATFGREYVDPSGHLDRRALGRRVFGDRQALARLGLIVHPRVLARAAQILHALQERGVALAVFDAAALVEAGLTDTLDGLIVVTAGRSEQLDRIMTRDGLSRQDAEQRIDAQIPSEQKIRLADYVLDNSGSLDDLEQEVEALVHWLRGQDGPQDP